VARRSLPWRRTVAAGLLAFLAVLAVRVRPPSPALRAPRQYQLAALVDRQQQAVSSLRDQLDSLRSQVDGLTRQRTRGQRGVSALDSEIRSASLAGGLLAVRGPAVRVSLDDSTLTTSPSGDVNDLVIHSQDVQAVVNALWRAGAEAVAVNGQRVVSTSAVECVGNTLLLDGTISSPPYVAVGVGAAQDRFESDPLVIELHALAATYGLRFDVSGLDDATVAAYKGAVQPKFAQPATAG